MPFVSFCSLLERIEKVPGNLKGEFQKDQDLDFGIILDRRIAALHSSHHMVRQFNMLRSR